MLRRSWFRHSPSSFSQMERGQSPNSVTRRGNINIDLQSLEKPSPSTNQRPDGDANGHAPYWLNPLYLAAILSQNNGPVYSNNGKYYSECLRH